MDREEIISIRFRNNKIKKLNTKNDLELIAHNKILELTDWYTYKSSSEKVNIRIRYFIFKNNIKKEDLLCSVCGKIKKINSSLGIPDFCSVKCSRGQSVEKTKKTCLEKYGVDNPAKTKLSKDKYKETCLRKYGVESYNSTEDSKNKSKETCLEKYGTDSYIKTKDFKDKSKETCLEKYGVDSFNSTKESKDKIKETCLEKYGVDSFSKTEEFKRKVIENTHILNQELFNNKEYIIKNFLDKDQRFMAKEFSKFFNTSEVNSYTKINQLGIKYQKYKGKSLMEKEIIQFIKEIYSGEIITNTRKVISPLELDIFIPEHNLAIEFNGLYFHSYGKNNISDMQGDINYQKNRHLIKTNLCESKNINLLHINEDEWLNSNKQEIWKSIIRNKLKLNTNKIFARKTIIKEVSTTEARIFLDKNHIQGAGAIGKIKLGLYYNNDLVSLMTFGIPRFNKEAQFELIRFCSDLNTSIVGGAQKLFKYFQKNINVENKKIISYANRRFAYIHNNIYKTLGLIEQEKTNPNMFIIDKNNIVWPRQKFQKHKLSKIPDFNFNENLTATQNKIENGYRILWDSGNLKFFK
jgi:hypothetical protein